MARQGASTVPVKSLPILIAALLVAAMLAVGCGGSNDTATTVTVESKAKNSTQLSPDLEARFEVADELERRAERRLIEAETANREGREAESLSLSTSGERLLEQAETVIADIEKINREER